MACDCDRFYACAGDACDEMTTPSYLMTLFGYVLLAGTLWIGVMVFKMLRQLHRANYTKVDSTTALVALMAVWAVVTVLMCLFDWVLLFPACGGELSTEYFYFTRALITLHVVIVNIGGLGLVLIWIEVRAPINRHAIVIRSPYAVLFHRLSRLRKPPRQCNSENRKGSSVLERG